MPASDKKVTFGKQVQLQRTYPENLQSHFVVNMVVQHQPDMFILSFFEVWPPAILGETDEEKQEMLDSLESVEAKCVARLVVTPSRMREFIAVMNENLSNYERLIKALSSEEGK